MVFLNQLDQAQSDSIVFPEKVINRILFVQLQPFQEKKLDPIETYRKSSETLSKQSNLIRFNRHWSIEPNWMDRFECYF